VAKPGPHSVSTECVNLLGPGRLLVHGWFGINIHAGGSGVSVGPNSAGCQLIAGGWKGAPWLDFIGLTDGSGQDIFHYYLLDGARLRP
jgi:hypothetical protein